MSNIDAPAESGSGARWSLIELLFVAESLCENRASLSPKQAEEVARGLIDILESPFSESYNYRRLAADALACLAARSRRALILIIESAVRYAALQEDVGDADPYSPNSVEVLAECPRCDEVLDALRSIASRPGMAQSVARSALSVLGMLV